MDRQIVYPGQILPETSLLQMAKDAMIGSAKLAAAVLGTSTIANGFAVTPTGPASLQIVVAPGEIYSLANIDSLAFSSLPADTTHSILKQGIMLDGVTLSCSAPTTTGQSINYLVQATYQDQDSTPVLLPYYNSANPALPYSGMGNNGMTQNTARKGAAIVQVKAGASAATGSQVTPAPDAGYVGLYVVTVAFGQTTITSASIAQYASAPLLPSGLLQSVQSGNVSFSLDTGTANAYVCAFSPAIATRFEGQILRFKVKTTNTGASTFNDGLGTVPVVGGAHTPLQGGELFATGDAWVQWNSSIGSGSYILLFCTGAPEQIVPGTQANHAATVAQVGAATIGYGLDTGAANAYAVTYSPPVTAVVDGLALRFKATNANTGPSTFNPNGLGTKPLVGTGHVALQGGEIVSTSEVWVQYNATFGGTGAWVLIESTGGALQIPPATQSQQAINLSQATSTFAALSGNSSVAFSVNTASGANQAVPLSQAQSTFAAIAGSSSQAFSVAAASTGSQAVNLTQANAAYAASAGNSSNAFNVSTAVSATQATPLAQVQSLVAGSPTVQGAFKNLRLLATGTGRSVVVSADEIVLENTSNQYVTLRGVSITGNNGTGMDTGTVASSTWYSVWLIYNGSTQFVLFSLSTTSPTMPGGYTYKARIGWIRTDSTANAYPLGFIQAGRSFKYVLAAGSNMTAFPQMASGVSGSIATPSYSSVAVASFFPPTAAVVETIVGVAAPNGFVMVAADSAYGAYTSATSIPFTYSAGTNGPYSSGFARFILDTPNIYWASSLAGNTLNALGWEDNL
ncbi:hypothetical protein [Pseudomonas sp. GV105]|uniref:hypothetical protein n=1 Tax=Pseudomonas sp. GV105 TaxID=2135759 RepID=UPI000D3D0B9C|nr:hypothetical protein [Pseudomonas sp. GV105]